MIVDESGRVVAPEQPQQDEHPARLRRVCAWCQAVLDQGTPGAETTHGICADCEEKF